MLKAHRMRDDAWSAFNGKVYNLTYYLPYHPGGEKELMRVAGRDGTKLFGEFFYHHECDLRCHDFSFTHDLPCISSSIDPCMGEHRLYAR